MTINDLSKTAAALVKKVDNARPESEAVTLGAATQKGGFER